MDVKDIRSYEEAWKYCSNMLENRFEKFAECFISLAEQTEVKEAKSIISVGVG